MNQHSPAEKLGSSKYPPAEPGDFSLFVKTIDWLFAFFLFLTSCGAKQYRRGEKSGFLGDYSQMGEGKFNEALVSTRIEEGFRMLVIAMETPMPVWLPESAPFVLL